MKRYCTNCDERLPDISRERCPRCNHPFDPERADSVKRARNDEGRFVIYYGGRFLDDGLQPVDAATLASSTSGDTPIVLGTPPLLSIGEAMDARSRIDHERVVVTRLSPEWMERLAREMP